MHSSPTTDRSARRDGTDVIAVNTFRGPHHAASTSTITNGATHKLMRSGERSSMRLCRDCSVSSSASRVPAGLGLRREALPRRAVPVITHQAEPARYEYQYLRVPGTQVGIPLKL